MERLVRTARRWWPPVLMFATAVFVEARFRARYDPRGHAYGHLQSATALFVGIAAVAIILWSAPTVRRRLDVWVVAAAWLGALLGVLIGNMRVVNAIGSANWSDADAARLGPGTPGFESGHHVAEIASILGLVFMIGLAVMLLRHGDISRRVCFGAIAVSIIIPWFIYPGAGVAVVAIALCLARRARLTAATSDLYSPRRLGVSGYGHPDALF